MKRKGGLVVPQTGYKLLATSMLVCKINVITQACQVTRIKRITSAI